MSGSDEFIPTPSVWRPPKGDVPTHVPTMSAAEKEWHRRNAGSAWQRHEESEQVAARVEACLLSTVTSFELRVLQYIRTNGRLTAARLIRVMDPCGQLHHDEDPAGALRALHVRGYLKRNPGRGGPYSLTARGHRVFE